jgi:hypothetical protein
MAHPHAGQCQSGQERAKARYADGGEVDSNMERAKNTIRGLTAMAPKSSMLGTAGTFSGKSASDWAAEDTQNMADSIRGQKKGD